MTDQPYFGVPLGGAGLIAPKNTHKFRIRFKAEEIDMEPLTQFIIAFDRPSFNVPAHLNEDGTYSSGKPYFSPLFGTIRDDLIGIVDSLTSYRGKFTMYIETLNGANDEVTSRWTVSNCSWGYVKPSPLSYERSDQCSYHVHVDFENAHIETL